MTALGVASGGRAVANPSRAFWRANPQSPCWHSSRSTIAKRRVLLSMKRTPRWAVDLLRLLAVARLGSPPSALS
jgi:hypothetical protein